MNGGGVAYFSPWHQGRLNDGPEILDTVSERGLDHEVRNLPETFWEMYQKHCLQLGVKQLTVGRLYCWVAYLQSIEELFFILND